MPRYVTWLKALPGKPVFVGYPASYDFLFVHWYLVRFAGESPFGVAALDMKTYAMALLGTPFRATTTHTMPRDWFDKHVHTHVALDDALEQGAMFCNMLAQRRRQARTAAAATLRQVLERIVRGDARLMQLLHVARSVGLPQWRVVAGLPLPDGVERAHRSCAGHGHQRLRRGVFRRRGPLGGDRGRHAGRDSCAAGGFSGAGGGV